MAETKSCCNDKVSGKIREAVCIDTNRVYDSCADKDCLADLRVYFPPQYQQTIDRATNVRCRGCEILNVFIDVERVPFNRGFYSVDITFFFKVTLDAYSVAAAPPETVCGFTTFQKMHTLRQRGQGKGILLRVPCGLGRQANHSAKHKSESKNSGRRPYLP